MMKPKRNFKFGSLKGTDPSCYINHEKIDIPSKCPTLKKVIETSDVKLFDLPKLQVEVEKIMSNVGYRVMNLQSLIDGRPMKSINGVNLNKPTHYMPFITLPIEESHSVVNENHGEKIDEELIVKSDPEKPLTLIIAQNRPSTRRNSQNQSTKRKLIDEVIEPAPKKQKSMLSNNLHEKDNKPNYEIPNKFWELMEPYCAEINDEHIKTLENYIHGYENDAKYYELPYIEDHNTRLSDVNKATKVTMSRRNSTTVVENNLNGFVDNKNSIELSNLLKKIDNEIRKPLSQSKSLKGFPQSFVNKISMETDELISSHKEKIKDSNSGISSEASCVSKSLAKQLKVSNSYKIERHIKKSMEDLGMCDFDLPFIPKLEPQFDLCAESEKNGIAKSSEADIIDPNLLNSEDFIALNLPDSANSTKRPELKEDKAVLGLRRRQAELRLVSESNLGMLRRLLVAARRDMRRQEIERRLAVADADVIESYNVIESYRPTRRPPLKKDRDAAYKSLKERQKILRELEAFDSELM